jgi:hypothetical protein
MILRFSLSWRIDIVDLLDEKSTYIMSAHMFNNTMHSFEDSKYCSRCMLTVSLGYLDLAVAVAVALGPVHACLCSL